LIHRTCSLTIAAAVATFNFASVTADAYTLQ
jgi:hypothetical protein